MTQFNSFITTYPNFQLSFISQSQNIKWCLAKDKTSMIWMVIVLDRNSLDRFF